VKTIETRLKGDAGMMNNADARFTGSVQVRRTIRLGGSRSETMLWQRLRSRKLEGFTFRRKHGIGCYIVDFYCQAAGIAVQIDRLEATCRPEVWTVSARRRAQDEFLRSLGVEVLRLSEQEIFDDLEALVMRVAERVRRRIEERTPKLSSSERGPRAPVSGTPMTNDAGPWGV
jgi:very-short-patch-repair endonuclease